MVKRASLILIIGLAIVAGMVGKVAAASASPDESQRLVVLLIIDTLDPSIGTSVEKDGQNMENLLTDGFSKYPDRLLLTKLSGKNCTREEIQSYFAKLAPLPNDTLMVFFAGHGATVRDREKDETLRSIGHAMLVHTANDKRTLLERNDLRNMMLAKQPRLTILLSDCCGDYYDRTPEVRREIRVPDWRVMQALFLKPRGVVDINSVSEGESALGSAEGGFFTLAFANLVRRELVDIFPENNEPIHWHDLAPLLQDRSQEAYGSYRRRSLTMLSDKAIDSLKTDEEKEQYRQMRTFLQNQSYQTVRVFQMPSNWQFGARLLDNGGDGVKIAFLYDGTPAADAGFKSGDVIVAVGDQRIESPDQFAQLLKGQQSNVKVQFRRGRSTQESTLKLPHDRGAGQDY